MSITRRGMSLYMVGIWFAISGSFVTAYDDPCIGSGCKCTAGYVTARCDKGYVNFIPIPIRHTVVDFEMVDTSVKQLNLINFSEYWQLKRFTVDIPDKDVCIWLKSMTVWYPIVTFTNSNRDQCREKADTREIRDKDDSDYLKNSDDDDDYDNVQIVRLAWDNVVEMMFAMFGFICVCLLGKKLGWVFFCFF